MPRVRIKHSGTLTEVFLAGVLMRIVFRLQGLISLIFESKINATER